MTPESFLEGLLVHFGKRHVDDRAEQIWTRDMLGAIRGTDPRVLAKAYTMVVSEHEERAFPLPAVLRRYIERACETVYPETQPKSDKMPDLTPPTPEARERARKILDLGVAAIKSAANRHASVVPAVPAAPPDVSRPAFEEMQRLSKNYHLHVDYSKLTRRITGERDE